MIVFLDTNIVIDFVEMRNPWAPKIVSRFASMRSEGDHFGVSDLTMMECFVGPLITGNNQLYANYETYFKKTDLTILAIPPSVYHRAARIRAKWNLKVIDSIHLATAAEQGCGLFLTQDKMLVRCPDIPVEVIT